MPKHSFFIEDILEANSSSANQIIKSSPNGCMSSNENNFSPSDVFNYLNKKKMASTSNNPLGVLATGAKSSNLIKPSQTSLSPASLSSSSSSSSSSEDSLNNNINNNSLLNDIIQMHLQQQHHQLQQQQLSSANFDEELIKRNYLLKSLPPFLMGLGGGLENTNPIQNNLMTDMMSSFMDTNNNLLLTTLLQNLATGSTPNANPAEQIQRQIMNQYYSRLFYLNQQQQHQQNSTTSNDNIDFDVMSASKRMKLSNGASLPMTPLQIPILNNSNNKVLSSPNNNKQQLFMPSSSSSSTTSTSSLSSASSTSSSSTDETNKHLKQFCSSTSSKSAKINSSDNNNNNKLNKKSDLSLDNNCTNNVSPLDALLQLANNTFINRSGLLAANLNPNDEDSLKRLASLQQQQININNNNNINNQGNISGTEENGKNHFIIYILINNNKDVINLYMCNDQLLFTFQIFILCLKTTVLIIKKD